MSDPHAWRDRAACTGQDVETFFPRQGTHQPAVDRVIATWCAPCPVRVDCLADELAHPPTRRGGVRGGVAFPPSGQSHRVPHDPYGYLPAGRQPAPAPAPEPDPVQEPAPAPVPELDLERPATRVEPGLLDRHPDVDRCPRCGAWRWSRVCVPCHGEGKPS